MDHAAEQLHHGSNPLLSIVVPFYNSESKSDRLLTTLGSLRAQDVEIICVDDGSRDATLQKLEEFRQSASVPTVVLSQENRGPGGARNTGLRAARGEFVWFIDSDDDVSLDAVEILREARADNIDFIDFNFNVGARNAMKVPAGLHVTVPGEREALIADFGSLVTKIFSKRFMDSSGFVYPEHCYYEDNELSFSLAMTTRRYLKSERELYRVHVDFASVTRGKVTPRFFDRLHTAATGTAKALPLAESTGEREAIAERFRGMFAVNTCRQLFRKLTPKVGLVAAVKAKNWRGLAHELPSRLNPLPWLQSVLLSARVMRFYRQLSKSLLGRAGSPILDGNNVRLRGFLVSSWLLSFVLPEQENYFAKIRARAWPVGAGVGGGVDFTSRPHAKSGSDAE